MNPLNSAILYLNDDFFGGDFFFAHQNMSVQVGDDGDDDDDDVDGVDGEEEEEGDDNDCDADDDDDDGGGGADNEEEEEEDDDDDGISLVIFLLITFEMIKYIYHHHFSLGWSQSVAGWYPSTRVITMGLSPSCPVRGALWPFGSPSTPNTTRRATLRLRIFWTTWRRKGGRTLEEEAKDICEWSCEDVVDVLLLWSLLVCVVGEQNYSVKIVGLNWGLLQCISDTN